MIEIGTDIVELSRFNNNYNDVANKILSEKELNYFNEINSKKRQIEFVAGRWAAKEAVTKALDHTPIFSEINIQLVDEALVTTYNDLKIKISISHSDTNAIAFCVWEK